MASRNSRYKQTAIPAPEPARSAIRRWAWLVLVAIVGLAFANALSARLLFDSKVVIGQDWRLSGATWEHFRAIFTQDYWAGAQFKSGLFRPIATVTYWLQKAVFGNGEAAGPYVAANIAVHAGNSVLLFLLLTACTGARRTALLAAACFGAHPLVTEAVTNVVGRADLLSATAVLGILLIHRHAHVAPARRRPWLRTAELLLFAAGLLSKESAVVATALVVVHDAAFPRPEDSTAPRQATLLAVTSWFRAIRANIALLAGFAAVFGAVWAWRAGVVRNLEPAPVALADNPIVWAPLLEAQLTAIKTILLGLRLVVWPVGLSAEYGYNAIPLVQNPPDSAGEWAACIGGLLLCVWLVAVLWRLHRWPVAAFLSLGWFVTLAPVSNFFVRIGTIFGERLLYLPLAFLVPLVVYLAAGAFVRVCGPFPVSHRFARSVAAVSVAILAVLTHLRNRDWHDEAALFGAAASSHPQASRAHTALAYAIFSQAEVVSRDDPHLQRAIAHAEKGAQIFEQLPPEHRPFNAALALAEYLRARATLTPVDDPRRSADLARAQTLLEGALACERSAYIAMRRSIADDTTWGDGRLRKAMGRCLLDSGQSTEALPYLVAAVARNPRDDEAYGILSEAYFQLGRFDDAAQTALEGVITNASNPEVFERGVLAFQMLNASDLFGGKPGQLELAGGAPLVRRLLDAACLHLYQLYLPHDHDRQHATAFRTRAVRDFGCSNTLFDQAQPPIADR